MTGALSFDPATRVVLQGATDASSIELGAAHGLATGERVVYSSGGGKAMGGLTDGATYYVIRVSDTRLQFAASAADATASQAIVLTAGAEGAAHSLTLATARQTFDPAAQTALLRTDTITFPAAEGFNPGDHVVYSSGGGQAIGGLKDGADYYVIRVSAAQLRLAASAADATAAKAIDLTAGATGTTHSLALFSAPHSFDPATQATWPTPSNWAPKRTSRPAPPSSTAPAPAARPWAA